QLRQPRVAEMVAEALRERIVSGELPDGSSLPKQDDLLEEFGVSKPSAREAFRILETEGLVTVQRGNVGGAVVHLPNPGAVAYTLSLVLQARNVSLEDVGLALQQIEPVCAALCAGRSDRQKNVLPALRAAHERLGRALSGRMRERDEQEVTEASRSFHEEIVGACGNETMIVVAGALETIWSAHERSWSERAAQAGHFPEPRLGAKALKEHAEILTAIEMGDADRASRTARHHLVTAQLYPLSESPDAPVRAATLRQQT
ncbi:MAG TPA: FCD domain-containing protein, partial [Acidimicrobiales bacterium]|nr:FCD domain-containing protein [Acidimicrobiales bacterium]